MILYGVYNKTTKRIVRRNSTTNPLFATIGAAKGSLTRLKKINPDNDYGIIFAELDEKNPNFIS